MCIVLLGIWFVDTNNKWLAQKELQKTDGLDVAPSQDVTPNDSDDAIRSVQSDSENLSRLDCMMIAGEASQGDFEIYKRVIDACT